MIRGEKSLAFRLMFFEEIIRQARVGGRQHKAQWH